MPALLEQTVQIVQDSLKRLTQDVAALQERVSRISSRDGPGWYVPFTVYAHVGQNITADSTVFLSTVPRAYGIRSWCQIWYQDATLDGSNYWTIFLFASDYGIIHSFDTSGGTATTWTRNQWLDQSIQLTTDDLYVSVYVEKTGAPGGLYLACPAVYAV